MRMTHVPVGIRKAAGSCRADPLSDDAPPRSQPTGSSKVWGILSALQNLAALARPAPEVPAGDLKSDRPVRRDMEDSQAIRVADGAADAIAGVSVRQGDAQAAASPRGNARAVRPDEERSWYDERIGNDPPAPLNIRAAGEVEVGDQQGVCVDEHGPSVLGGDGGVASGVVQGIVLKRPARHRVPIVELPGHCAGLPLDREQGCCPDRDVNDRHAGGIVVTPAGTGSVAPATGAAPPTISATPVSADGEADPHGTAGVTIGPEDALGSALVIADGAVIAGGAVLEGAGVRAIVDGGSEAPGEPVWSTVAVMSPSAMPATSTTSTTAAIPAPRPGPSDEPPALRAMGDAVRQARTKGRDRRRRRPAGRRPGAPPRHLMSPPRQSCPG